MAIEQLRECNWVLIPGTLCTEDVFIPFLDELEVSEDKRISIKLDRPNVHDYETLLKEESKDAVVCGFSLGAIVAAHNAAVLNAKRIVLFGLNPLPDRPQNRDVRLSMEQSVMAFGGSYGLEKHVPEIQAMKVGGVKDKILSMADRSSAYIQAQTQLALTRPDALSSLSAARTTVMLLTGSNDSMTPPNLAEELTKKLTTCCFASLSGLGHYALLEDPKRCAHSYLELESRL